MNWSVGQKVAALYNIAIYNQDGLLLEHVIEINKTYQIDAIEDGCCMKFLDVGKAYNENGTALFYQCKKCKKQYRFMKDETILFDENWFTPFDENESMMSRAARKISKLLSKKKKAGNYFVKIKVRAPVALPFLDPEYRPVVQPKREIEIRPEREKEFV